MRNFKKAGFPVGFFLSLLFASVFCAQANADVSSLSKQLAGLRAGQSPETQSLAFYLSNSALSRGSLRNIGSFAHTALANQQMNIHSVFYPYSSSDVIYPFAFFPNTETLVLVAVESVGDLPPANEVSAATKRIGNLFKQLASLSFFRTFDIQPGIRALGQAPMIAAGLSYLGFDVISVQRVSVDSQGQAVANSEGNGSEIHFRKQNGQTGVVYYFNQDLSDNALMANPQFIGFLQRQSFDAAFLKAASYLPHDPGFRAVNNFIAGPSNPTVKVVVQTDDGIPFSYFGDGSWQKQFYGIYTQPLPEPFYYVKSQADLLDAYLKSSCSMPGVASTYQVMWRNQNVCAGHISGSTSAQFRGFVPFAFGYDSFRFSHHYPGEANVPAGLRKRAINLQIYSKN